MTKGTPREISIDDRIFRSVGGGKDRKEGREKGRRGEAGTGRWEGVREAGMEQAQPHRAAAPIRPRERDFSGLADGPRKLGCSVGTAPRPGR